MQIHNLLHREDKRRVRMMYYFRVLVVANLFLVVVLLLGMAALAPAYLLMSSARSTAAELLATHGVGAEDRESVEQEVAAVRALLETVTAGEEDQQVTAYLDVLLAERPEGVVLSGFSYDAATATVVLEGVAARRADLVEYTSRLENSPHTARVVLPISDLARNVDLRFHITIEMVEVDASAV